MKKVIYLLLGALMLFSACTMNTHRAALNETTGTLDTTFSENGVRTILPDISMEIASYDIAGTGPNGTSFSRPGTAAGGSTRITALLPGKWTIAVNGKNSMGTVIADGTADAVIASGTVTGVTVVLGPIAGNGTLIIVLDWAEGIFNNAAVNISASVQKEGQSAAVLNAFSGSGDSRTSTTLLINGYYRLSLTVTDGIRTVSASDKVIRIVCGASTTADLTVTDTGIGTGSSGFVIDVEMDEPISITLNGAMTTLMQGDDMTVTAQTSLSPVDSYQWYLDGAALSGATASSITVGGTLPANTSHRLSVLVTKGQIINSASVTFNIEGIDLQYLKDIYSATFNGMVYFVNPATGLPYDIWNDPGKVETSTSNIGLYIACIAAGYRTGLISEASAVRKINQTLSSLKNIRKWHGFPITWVRVDNPAVQAFGTSFSYADHVGNLVCGLLVARSVFGGVFDETIDDYIGAMDFADTYDPATKWLKGGYDVALNGGAGGYTVAQPWGSWYYNLLEADTRPFSLIGIALNEIPAEHFYALNRDNNSGGDQDTTLVTAVFPGKTSCPYYYPGMLGGGLFMQYLPGIFLKEKDYPTGISAKNFAYCQIQYAKKTGKPVWGMSACETPSRSYMGWGSMDLNIVSPHASVLAICDYPADVYKNLKALESRGVRPKYNDGKGNLYDFGFTDSYNIKTGQASSRYLCLDQAMLFLSLANYLHDDAVRNDFDLSPLGHAVNLKLAELETFLPLDIDDWK